MKDKNLHVISHGAEVDVANEKAMLSCFVGLSNIDEAINASLVDMRVPRI